MNKLTIIGNLTRDPDTRTLSTGDTACSFTVAVNRRGRDNDKADFFRVTAWNKLGDNCQRYLAKGRKVAVVGPVSVSSYEAKDGGGTRFSLDIRAEDVEFLSSRQDDQPQTRAPARGDADDSEFTGKKDFDPDDPNDLPF